MLRFRTPTVVLLGGMLAALLVLLAYRFQNSSRIDQGLQPLEFTDPALANALRLPKDAVVLAVSKTTLVTAPFLLHENPEGAGGWVLALPRGAGTKQKTGRTTLSFSTPVEGLYRAWTRVRWKDVCGNSVILKVGEAPEQVAVDQIYEAWHWVQAGEFNLSAGKQTATLLEREDGIELDQLLFTQDAGFQPAGPLPRAPRDASVPTLAEQTSNPDSKVPEAAASRLLKAQPLQEAAPAGHAGPIRELRRFADDFSRSPGHGLGGWDSTSGRWQIAFDFDPNRIPNQYALTADAAQGHAVTLLKGKPWNGCRLSFSLLPLEKGRYGALLDRADGREDLRVAFETVAGPSRLQVTGAGEPRRVDLDAAFRLRQWQRVVIERWGWVVRVSVDDRPVLALLDAAPSMGQVGLFVAAGSAVFDDVAVEEIPWQADDGRLLKLPWRLGAGAQWFRPTEPGAAAALLGREGAISSEMDGWPVEEILLEEAPGNRPKSGTLNSPNFCATSFHSGQSRPTTFRVTCRSKISPTAMSSAAERPVTRSPPSTLRISALESISFVGFVIWRRTLWSS